MRSEVIAFPAKNRTGDIKRCADMLNNLQGQEATAFWRSECRAMAAHLVTLGYDDEAMRREVLEFQDAVQAELWSNSQTEENLRQDRK